MSPEREAACPKRMVYGPCGGVRPGGLCEVVPAPCPFASLPSAIEFQPAVAADPAIVATAAGPSVTGRGSEVLAAAGHRPVIVTDLSVPAFDVSAVRAVTRALVDSCDVLLVGQHQNRPDFAPTLMAQLVADAGSPAWVTVSCRDANRVMLQQELAGLAHVGADAVLCVTGDGRPPELDPDVPPVFDLDGTRLAELAAAAGLVVAVAESPDAEPTALRPGRLHQKERAGASIGILNHCASVARVADFMRAARALGVTIPVIASVAVFTDERSASVLRRFPGLELDETRIAGVLGARDPVAAGVDAAVHEAAQIVQIPGVVGVNLSGLGSGLGILAGAQVKAAAGRRIREQT